MADGYGSGISRRGGSSTSSGGGYGSGISRRSSAATAAPPKKKGRSFFGWLPAELAETAKDVGYGFADMAADYGTAVAKDVRDIPKGRAPFGRTGRVLARDALATAAMVDTAIPEPSWLPDWMKREVISGDAEKLELAFNTGRINRDDAKQAAKFWKEKPILGGLLVLPAVGAVVRAGSRGAIAGSIRAAQPGMSKRAARRIARRESRMPGYAAAQGVKGGIAPRVLEGARGVAIGRPYSRHPLGRLGQRAYDAASDTVERLLGPGAKFSTSQRAARAQERNLRKGTLRAEGEIVRLEREIRKGLGPLRKKPAGAEALVAALESPRGLTTRQAIEIKLADVRSLISRPRSMDEAAEHVARLERDLEKRLRPLVDAAFPPAARRSEQALRNVARTGRGRSGRAAGAHLEARYGVSSKGGGSARADAYAAIEDRILEMAARSDADPAVREVAALIEERNTLKAAVTDPDTLFAGKAGDFGMTGADNPEFLNRQAAALERALKDNHIDSPEFAKAVDAAETLSKQAEEILLDVLGVSADDLLARKNLVAQRWADKGLLPEGIVPEGRAYFPHRDLFESIGEGRIAPPTLAASGSVVGVPRKGRAFEMRANELRRYETGRVQADPRVLSNLARQRHRYLTTQEGRRYLYAMGDDIVQGEPIPERTFLIRNPDTSPETIPDSVRRAIEDPHRYAEIVDPDNAFPDPRTFQEWVDSWLYRGQGPTPEWLADAANVRTVPEGVVKTLLADVFSSAPRGSFASIFGSLNALARATTIYLPYGGVRYIARNTPQNMVLLAMTRPTAFLKLRRTIHKIRREEPKTWVAIKSETGTIPAAAGLPELAGRRRTRAQNVEGRLTDTSRKIAGRLGDVADEPWRAASWVGYADAYGFDTAALRRRLLDSDEPEIKRVRDDIAQRVRDDMLDFDAITPSERQHITRYLFVYAFRRAALKWPFMYAREYPERAAILSLIAAAHAREGTPDRVESTLEAGRTEIGGREVDLGWLMPHDPAAGTIEDLLETVRGTGGSSINWRPITGNLSPQYRSLVNALGYGQKWTGVKRSFVPGYRDYQDVGEGGSVLDQILRMLGADIRYVEPRR